MREFAEIVWKGLYPVYFVLSVCGVGYRIRRKKWTAFDTLLLAMLGIFELLAAMQPYVFYGQLVTSKRYLWMGLPLGLPWVAEGVSGVTQWLKNQKYKVLLPTILGVVLIGVNIYNSYSPIWHQKHSAAKHAEQTLSREIAAWIQNDWRTPKALPPVMSFKCDQYQSGKRPIVQSDWERIGWLCGGQNAPEFFAARHIMPDYIVTDASVAHPDYALVKVIASVNIYKRRKLAH